MSLAIRIIPVLLKAENSLVKGKQFNAWRTVGHPLQSARIHAMRSVDELMILDIKSVRPDCDIVEHLTENAFMPITFGGGITSIDDIKKLLAAGADKVCIKSLNLIQEASSHLGKQAICASLEARDRSVVEQAQEFESAGAGELLLQSVKRDGMMCGYDTDLIEKINGKVNIPVIASCGCGNYRHMVDATKAGASAVAAASLFLFTEATPLGAAKYLSNQGIEVRI